MARIRTSEIAVPAAAWAAFSVAFLGVVATAGAQDGARVLWMSREPAGAARASALGVELAGAGARVEVTGWPVGASAADRARTARQHARRVGADGALWLEREADGSTSVRAVAPDSSMVAWAPVPVNADARVVALVASSLLDELLEPRAPAPRDDGMALTIRVPSPYVLAPPAGAPPAVASVAPALRLADPSASPAAEAPREPQERDFYLEGGLAIAGIANGLGVGLGFYPHPSLRIDARLRATYVILGDNFAGTLTASLAWVSAADDGRFEVGLEGGGLLVNVSQECIDACSPSSRPIPGMVVGSYFGWSWMPDRILRMGFRLGMNLALVDWAPTPSPMLDLYLQVQP